MTTITTLLIGLIAFTHCYILFFEMFAWESRGKKVFKKIPDNLFKPTKGIAANLGLYNGFLAAGLIWTFFINNLEWRANIAVFFLICVSVAGSHGAITAAEKNIFFIQALPAITGLILIF